MRSAGVNKVVIADIDGVLSLDGHTFDPACMGNLSHVCATSQASVVLSTSRRNDPASLHTIFHVCEEYRIPLVGITTDLPISDDPVSDRVDEILDWVRRRKPSQWVALDDIDLLAMRLPRHQIDHDELARHFVHCWIVEGLTADAAQQAIIKLG